jgi:hypothetical protein
MTYITRVFEGLDRWLNVLLLDGALDQTISQHAASASQSGRVWGCVVCRWLSATVERDHCALTLSSAANTPRAGLLGALQLSVLFAVLTGGFWALFL